MSGIPFSLGGPSASLAVSNTTGNVALPAGIGSVLRLCNDGTKTVFVKLGVDNTVTAAITDMPILGGAIEVFSFDGSQKYIAGIAGGADSSTLRITRGEGI